MMDVRQTKIIVDNKAFDIKVSKLGQHMDSTLEEVNEMRKLIYDSQST